MSYRLENFIAKKSSEIFHRIRITYKLYSLKQDGSVRSLLGSNESIDRLMTKNQKWMYGNDKYIIRKVMIETHEEPIFKVISNSKRKRKR